MGSSGRKRALGLMALVFGGVLVVLLGLELVLRLAGDLPIVASPLYAMHDSDPVLGWRGMPGARLRFRRPDFDVLVENDDHGWRLPVPGPPKEPTRRWLFLGDSFAWGWGVEQGEVFTDVLQRQLPTDVGVYNRGVNAFSTGQQVLLLQQELERTPYDHVALLFYNNDLFENESGMHGRRPLFRIVEDRLVAPQQPPTPLLSPLTVLTKRWSRALMFLNHRIGLLRDRFRADVRPAFHRMDAQDTDYRTLPGHAITIRLLTEMRRLTEAHGATFHLVYVPHQTEVEHLSSPVASVRAIHAMLEAFAAQESIPLIDLTPAFHAAAARGAKPTFPNDHHWTAFGHQRAADVLLEAAQRWP